MCLCLLSLAFRGVTRQMEQTKRTLTEAAVFPWESMLHTPQYRSAKMDHGCRMQMGDHSIGRWVPSPEPEVLYTRVTARPRFVILFQMLTFLAAEQSSADLTTGQFWGG